MLVERKTFARFMQSTSALEVQEVPPGYRDPHVAVLGGPPDGVIAVQFYDAVVVEVEDPANGEIVICESEPRDVDPGWHYYRGWVSTKRQVDNWLDASDKSTGLRLFDLFERNGMNHVIMVGDNLYPFYSGRDQVLRQEDPPGTGQLLM
jgi:hypothetical protein